jgi:hypothetical protein
MTVIIDRNKITNSSCYPSWFKQRFFLHQIAAANYVADAISGGLMIECSATNHAARRLLSNELYRP